MWKKKLPEPTSADWYAGGIIALLLATLMFYVRHMPG